MAGTNPFEVEDEGTSTDRLVQQVKDKVKQAEDGDVEVDTEPDYDEEETTATPQGVGIHQQKKRERVSRFKEEAESARRETEELRIQNVRLEAARVAAETIARTSRAEPAVDKHQERLTKLQEQKANLYNAYQARENAYTTAKQSMPADELANYRKQAQDLNTEEDELKLERFAEKRGLNAPQQNPQVAAITAWLNMEHPDVMKHDDARRYAVLRYETLKAEGHGETRETVNLAMSQARQRYGLSSQNRPAPTPASRSMYAGSTTRGPARRTTEESGNGKITMTPAMQSIAIQTFSKLAREKGDDAAIKHWAKTVGPSYLAKRAQSARKS